MALSTSAINVTKTLPSSAATVVIGFNFNASALPGAAPRSIARLLYSGTVHVTLALNSSGTLSVTRAGTVLATSAATISLATDQYIELKATIHDTTGAYELRLNGVNILSATNVDTRNASTASIDQISLGPDGNPAATTTYLYDDLYVLDTSGSTNNDFLGDVRIDAIYPTADGTYTDWTPSTGSDHYALVDESTPNGTDYVSSSTAAEQDSFAMGSPPVLASEIIMGVRVKVAALKDDAGSRSIKVGVRSGTTDSLSAAQALTTSQMIYSHILETDPNTSAAWLPGGIDALQTMIESV